MKGVALRFVLPLLVLLAPMAPPRVEAQAAPAPIAEPAPKTAAVRLPRFFYKRLEGAVAPHFEVVINLLRDGDRLWGTITPKSSGVPMELSYESRMEGDGSFVLRVRPRSADSGGSPFAGGTFRGDFTAERVAIGTWTDGDGKASAAFSVRESYPPGTAHFELARSTRAWTADRGEASVEILYPVPRSTAEPLAAKRIRSEILSKLLRGYTGSEDVAARPTVDGILNDFIDRFLDEVHDPALPSGYYPSWDDRLVSWVVFNGDGIVSLKSMTFRYEGGAHPTTTYRLSSYCLATGRPIDTLSELLEPGYEPTMNALAEAALREEYAVPPGTTLARAGFFVKPGAFELPHNFLVTGSGIEFQFNQYEIGPYVFGSPDLFIPYAKFRGWVRPDGPIGRLLR